MGSLTAPNGILMPEVVARTRAMKGAYKGIRAKVVRNLGIPVQDRMSVVLIYLITKGFFQAGAWRSLSCAEARKVHTGLMSIYRGLLRVDCPGCVHKSDDQVIIELKCLSPLSTVVFLRIAFLVRVISKKKLPIAVSCFEYL